MGIFPRALCTGDFFLWELQLLLWLGWMRNGPLFGMSNELCNSAQTHLGTPQKKSRTWRDLNFNLNGAGLNPAFAPTIAGKLTPKVGRLSKLGIEGLVEIITGFGPRGDFLFLPTQIAAGILGRQPCSLGGAEFHLG